MRQPRSVEQDDASSEEFADYQLTDLGRRILRSLPLYLPPDGSLELTTDTSEAGEEAAQPAAHYRQSI